MDKELNRVIEKYRQQVEALGIKVQKIILYGSYAVEKAKEDSDVDLLVMSDDFKNMDMWDRLCLLGRARIGIKKPMEILGLTKEEFTLEGIGSFVWDEIKLKGIEVT